jgi:hypothetical protein
MFNPEKNFGQPEELFQEEQNEEASRLSEKLSQKSLGERFISEYQTRESKVRGEEIERGESTRYERGQIYKAYKILRSEIHDAQEKGEDVAAEKGFLKEMRIRAKQVERNLDELEKQMENNVQMVDIETGEGKSSVPVTVLDLKNHESQENEKDNRTPYVFWGGIRSTAQQNGCAVMSMALTGQKVYVLTHLEQKSVEKPANLKEILNNRGDFSLHAEITEKAAEKLNLEKFNLVGYSTGATIALETAIRMSQSGTSERINDLLL